MVDDAVLFDTRADLRRKLLGALGEQLVLVEIAHDLRRVAERDDREHVRRDQIAVYARVVARAEAGPGHAGHADRRAVSLMGERVSLRAVDAVEEVRRIVVVLLALERLEDALGARLVLRVELRRAARFLPEQVRELHRVAERVDLVLALPDPRAFKVRAVDLQLVLAAVREDLARVLRPRAAVRLHVEGVRVRVDRDALELAADQALDAVGNLRVLLGDRQVVAHLRGRVAQPHGRDVAGDDEGVLFADHLHRRVHRVRVAVFKKFFELFVAGEFFGNALHFQIDCFHNDAPSII